MKNRSIYKTTMYVTIFLMSLTTFHYGANAQQINNKKVLLIGVKDYKNASSFGSLQYTHNDVHNLRDAFSKAGYSVVCMTDNRRGNALWPNSDNILHQIGVITDNAEYRDILLVYLSGHGVKINGNLYFVPADADLANFEESFVRIDEICARLNSSSARETMLIIDCCRNAPDRIIRFKGIDNRLLTEKSLTSTSLSSEDLTASLTTNFCVLLSCQDGERSIEDSFVESSIFSFYLADALTNEMAAGRDGVISVESLFDYVRFNVSRHARNVGHSQNPELVGRMSNQIVLAKIDSRSQHNPRQKVVQHRDQQQQHQQRQQAAYHTTQQPRSVDRPLVQAAGRAAISYGLSRIR